MYEDLLSTRWDGDTLFHHQLIEISKQHPLAGCRILKRVLALTLEKMRATDQGSKDSFFSNPFSEFDDRSSGGLKVDDGVLKALAEREPDAFLETVWEFFEGVLPLGRPYYGTGQTSYFPSDAFHDVWEIRTTNGMILRHHFGFALANAMRQALKTLATEKPDVFAKWEHCLSTLCFQTPQMMLLDVYRKAPERYATPACNWLLADIRRLDLGNEQWETRDLIRAIIPQLISRQILQLEEHIWGFLPLQNSIASGLRDTWLLKHNGVEQWRLLHSVGGERLSDAGSRRLREWDDKFHDRSLTARPITGGSGFVGSPINLDTGRKMSDAAWLKAMAHYQKACAIKTQCRYAAARSSWRLKFCSHLSQNSPPGSHDLR